MFFRITVDARLYGIEKIGDQIEGEELALVDMAGKLQVESSRTLRSQNRAMLEQECIGIFGKTGQKALFLINCSSRKTA